MSEAEEQGKAAREAADWLARLNSRSVSTDELNAFYEWRRHPENAAAYARGEQVWHDSRSLGDDRDVAAAVREALERPRLAHTDARFGLINRRAFLVGSGAVLAAAGAGWLLLGRAVDYRTDVGQQLLVTLEDGSRMRLNTATEASVSFDAHERDIRIGHGEALFEVSHDPRRPFKVESGGLTVTARGTRFSVRRLAGEPARIILIDGRIEIASSSGAWVRSLSGAGECLSVRTEAAQPELHRLDPEAALSWTAGRLTFRTTPLAQAIAEVNRYSQTQIVLEAAEFANQQVDGVFEIGDPAAFVSAVSALFPLRARNVNPERIVLVRG